MTNLLKKTKNTIKKHYDRLTPKQKKMAFLLEFLLRFLVAAVPIYVIMYFNIDLYRLEVIEASQIKYIVDLFGVQTQEYLMTIGNRLVPVIRVTEILKDVAIDEACTGYRTIFAFVGLIFAYPRIKMKKRAYGLLIGIPIIYAVNIIRVVTTIMSAVWFGAEYMDVVHTVLWREGLILIIFFLWVFWLKKIAQPK